MTWVSTKSFTMLGLVLLIFTGYLTNAIAKDIKHILILNAYHEGYKWTDDEVAGIVHELKSEWPDSAIFIEYMGTKWTDSEAYFKLLSQVYKTKFARISFDAIVATDNDAFNFLHEHRDEVFGKIPVVFCGVNYLKESEVKDFDLVTGVNEWADIESNIDLILGIHPDTKRIVIITDTSITGQRIHEQIMGIIPRYVNRVQFQFLEDLGMDDLLHRVTNLPSNSVILFTFFFSDKNGRLFEASTGTSLISQASKIPIYGAWDFSLGHGIIGGNLTSGLDQGKAAGVLTVEVLYGKNTHDLPIIMRSPNAYMFDYTQMQRFGISLSQLPRNAVVINGPAATIAVDKRLIWVVAGGIGTLLLIVIILISNIYYRKRAEIALRESEEQYRSLVNNINIGIYRTTNDGRFLQINPAMVQMFGYTDVEELMGIPATQLYTHEKDREKLWETLQQSGYIRDMIIGMKKRDGTPLWVSLTAAMHPCDKDNVKCLDGVVDDITERMNNQESLRLSEERYRALFENNPTMYFSLDSSGTILSVNQYGYQQLGFSSEELIGHPLQTLFHPEDRDMVQQQIARCLENPMQVINWELRKICKDGSMMWVKETARAVLGTDGNMIVLIVCEDITEKLQLQNQLQIAQKMEAIGTLAGGIAHDFNNILTAIIGFTEMALYKAGEEALLRQDLKRVLEAGSRAKDLVAQILLYCRRGKMELRPINILQIVQETLKLIRHSLPSTIEMRQEFTIEPGGDVVLADPTQIHQVMMNLLTNAAQAMKDGRGLLTIGISAVEADMIVTRHPKLQVGPYVSITISDTGMGIDEEVVGRIFDPYFTTKVPGEGTGLGLSVVQGIVVGYGGAITVDSTPGKGTIFKVYLPVAAGTDVQQKMTMPDLLLGKGRILFVDDEEILVDLGSNMLSSLGYQVTALHSSPEALDAFRGQPDAYDLVITDLTMPKLTGEDLIREMKAICPEMPIILCSGYKDNGEIGKRDVLSYDAFLLKPYTKTELSHVVHSVLETQETL